MKKGYSFSLAAFFLTLFFLSHAQAITIDEFEGSQSENAGGVLDGPEAEKYSSLIVPLIPGTTRPSAIGGSRDVHLRGILGNSLQRTRFNTNLGVLNSSQDVGATGETYITWDGTNSSSFNPNGLGQIDFTQAAASAIDLDILSFDLPAGNPVTFRIVVYGESTKSSEYVYVLNTFIGSLTTISIPFASFTKVGSASAAIDWTKVGAVRLEILGYAEGIDLRIERFGTNSVCKLTPDSNGQILDECGVCGGDNSSCADCLGVPNGTAVAGTSCSNGQQGVCNGGTFNVSCGCVRTNDPSAELCDGLDNDCDGSVDETFPQLGSTCSDGPAPCDFNGTVICDATGGVKCDIPNLTNLVDACEDSKGCDGVPGSGLVYDSCSVCGGDNSTCTDCQGQLFGTAQPDRCNVCEGDGLSCLECNQVDQSTLLRTLDGGAKAQERLIKKIIAQFVIYRKDNDAQVYARRALAKARKLMLRNWTLSWQLPRIATTCGNKIFCAEVSNLPVINEYKGHADDLRKLGITALRRLLLAQGGHNSISVKFEKGIERLYLQNLKLADTVPVYESSCS